MSKSLFRLPCLFFIALTALSSYAQTLPITVQRQGEAIWFIAQAELNGFRVTIFDQQGRRIAESGAEAQQRWSVLTPNVLPTGIYLAVFWLRGTGEASKRLARLEVQATTQTLQTAEQYLRAVYPPDTVVRDTPEYQAIEQRAYERGVAAIPFFRTATKVLPDEATAHTLLVQAIRLKYARFNTNALAPPPPPDAPRTPTAAQRPATMRKEPTQEEQREMLAAAQKAVAVAKTCAGKTDALRWLALIQGELAQRAAQITTLEQIAQASCATAAIKAQSWHYISILHWECAYDLTTRYAHREQLTTAPFHYRAITNPADAQQLSQCLQQGFAAHEKALELQPDFAEAWSYRSLLWREKQKATAAPTDRETYAREAEKAARRAMELTTQPREKK